MIASFAKKSETFVAVTFDLVNCLREIRSERFTVNDTWRSNAHQRQGQLFGLTARRPK
jgi:hypothetical protein